MYYSHKFARRWHPKVSKGSETTTPPVAEKGGVEEASEKKQCERQRDNATIERAGPTGMPFGRARRHDILLLAYALNETVSL